MIKYFDTVSLTTGPAVVGASVHVTDHITGDDADLFANDGMTPIANPTTTNSYGMFEFMISPGRYDIAVTGGISITYEDVTIAQDVSIVYLENVSGSTMGFGDIVYSFGDGTVKLAESDSTVAKAQALAFCLETALANNASGRFKLLGTIPLSGTPGGNGYLSQVGDITETEPTSGAGDLYLVILGKFIDADTFNFKPQAPIGIT